MIPSSRPKLSDLYALSQRKLLENHTLHSGTYLYSPYMAVHPPPPGLKPTINETIAMKNEYIVNLHLRLLPWLPEQYLGSTSSKKRNSKLNTIPQVAKVYICTVKCQRKKHIENTFENQRPSTSPFFIIRMHLHWTQWACFVYKAGNFPLGYTLFLWLAWHAKLNIMEITLQLEGDGEGLEGRILEGLFLIGHLWYLVHHRELFLVQFYSYHI